MAVLGTIEKNTQVYTGPSEDTAQPNPASYSTALEIAKHFWQHNDFYYVELKDYKRRIWVHKDDVISDPDITFSPSSKPSFSKIKKRAPSKQTDTYYGPGDDYNRAGSVSDEEDVYVRATEGSYSYISYDTSNGEKWAWILSATLQEPDEGGGDSPGDDGDGQSQYVYRVTLNYYKDREVKDSNLIKTTTFDLFTSTDKSLNPKVYPTHLDEHKPETNPTKKGKGCKEWEVVSQPIYSDANWTHALDTNYVQIASVAVYPVWVDYTWSTSITYKHNVNKPAKNDINNFPDPSKDTLSYTYDSDILSGNGWSVSYKQADDSCTFTYQISKNELSASQYVFNGWEYSKDDKVYKPGDIISITVTKDNTKISNTENVSLSTSWTEGGIVYIYANGKWNKAMPYIYTGSSGGWKLCQPYIYKNGWKTTIV